MAAKFLIKKSTDGQYFFRLQAGNGEPILHSELYVAKASALSGIASVKANASDDARYERKAAAGGQFMFNLKASNGQVVGTSETYTTDTARDKGIESVKANAAGAGTDDQS